MIMDLKSFCTFLVALVFLWAIGGKVLLTSWDVDKCLICFSLSDTFSPLPMEPRHSKLTENSGLCADYVTSWFASVFYLEIGHLRLWLITFSVSLTSSPTVDRSWRAVFPFCLPWYFYFVTECFVIPVTSLYLHWLFFHTCRVLAYWDDSSEPHVLKG